MIGDTRHVTRDRYGEVKLLSKFQPLALTVWELRFVEDIQSYEDISTNHDSVS